MYLRSLFSFVNIQSLFHLSVLLNENWDYCANFEMDLIFPEIAFIVMEGNLGIVE